MRDKIKRFREEYIIDMNGRQTALRAGYTKVGRAEVQECRNLQKTEVQDYKAKLKAKQSKRTEITADKVLKQYRRLAFADIQDYYHTSYELRTLFSSSDDKEYRRELRTKRRLKRIYGRVLTEEQYIEVPSKYKSYYFADEVLKSFDLLTKEQRAAIAGITYDKSGRPILKLSTKETSLDALAKHLGVFEKDNKQKSVSVKVEQRTLSDFYGEGK